MKEYFLMILAVVIVSGVVVSLSPSGYAKQVRLLCGLFTTAFIMLPLVSFVADLDFSGGEWLDFFDEEQYLEKYDEFYNEIVKNVEIENANQMLKSKMIQDLSVENECFDVALSISNVSGEKFIEKVNVILYAEGISVDPHEVKNYVSALLGCECSVYYDF